ncbi:unnamed protein product, partial (mitochondrion) [Musa textilis]
FPRAIALYHERVSNTLSSVCIRSYRIFVLQTTYSSKTQVIVRLTPANASATPNSAYSDNSENSCWGFSCRFV